MILNFRARATNTQLGQEENSEFIELEVDTSQNLDVSPEIIVPPQNVTITRHKSVTELQCIANAKPLHLLSLIWLKDGKPIEQSGIPFYSTISGTEHYLSSPLTLFMMEHTPVR